MKETFVGKRFIVETKETFYELITKAKLKSMSARTKSAKLLTSSNKVVQYKQERNAAFRLLGRLYNHFGTRLDLRELMSYPLTPIPYSTATADGFFSKTNKAKGMKLITKDVDDEPFPHTMKLWSLKMEIQY